MDAVVKQLVDAVYPDEAGLAGRVMELVEKYRPAVAEHRERFSSPAEDFPLSSDDAVLITYGDTFRGTDGAPLEYLYRKIILQVIQSLLLTDFSQLSGRISFAASFIFW